MGHRRCHYDTSHNDRFHFMQRLDGEWHCILEQHLHLLSHSPSTSTTMYGLLRTHSRGWVRRCHRQSSSLVDSSSSLAARVVGLLLSRWRYSFVVIIVIEVIDVN
jgi:hypothetical protein